MLHESIESLNIQKDGLYIDGTFGRGGHSNAILNKLEDGKLVVFDKDHEAIAHAVNTISKDNRVTIKHSSYSKIYDYILSNKLLGKVNGIILDLGVSSPQILDHKRGFSFRSDNDLDMRMDIRQDLTASKWINSASINDMIHVFRKYGEVRSARRLANAIYEIRKIKAIKTTKHLADICIENLPKPKKIHPATTVFQAIRIYINEELLELNKFLKNVLEMLKIGGRLVIISFHSLEDRIVKEFINSNFHTKSIHKNVPIKYDDLPVHIKKFSLVKASSEEININPASRSARMRAMEKIK